MAAHGPRAASSTRCQSSGSLPRMLMRRGYSPSLTPTTVIGLLVSVTWVSACRRWTTCDSQTLPQSAVRWTGRSNATCTSPRSGHCRSTFDSLRTTGRSRTDRAVTGTTVALPNGQSREARRAAYLKAAVECRQRAVTGRSPEAQRELLRLAAQYEELAEFVMMGDSLPKDDSESDSE